MPADDQDRPGVEFLDEYVVHAAVRVVHDDFVGTGVGEPRDGGVDVLGEQSAEPFVAWRSRLDVRREDGAGRSFHVGGYQDACHPVTSFGAAAVLPEHSATRAFAWESPLSSTTPRTLWASRTSARAIWPPESVR